MRILLVTPILVPHILWAGSHRVVYDISKSLVKRGHEVVILTSDRLNVKEKISSEIDTHGCVKIIRSRTVNSSITEIMSMTISIDTSVFLKKILKNFEVVHAHEYRTYENIVLHHYARKYDIPYVLQAHGSLLRDMPKKRLKYVYDIFFGYRLLRDAFKVIALSSMEAEQYKRMGVPEEKIAIIPNGIDLSEYAELPPKGSFKKKFNIPEDKKIILYLGRIHKIKGIDFLVKAYAYLVNEMRCRDAILVIAGPDDGYLDDAKALANSLGIYNSVMFTGFISEEDKLKAFVDAEVFVTPSFYGFPLTFLEACAVGTPIVTTSLGDELEWIDNNVGYVSRPTPTDLAEAIYRIVFNEELHRRFSKNCIEIVNSKFSIEKVVEKLEKVYAEIVKG